MPLTRSPERAEQQLLGRAIRALRKRADLPQAIIADALDMSTAAWQKYEAGERKFTAEKMPTILRAIGVTDKDLEAERLALLGRGPEPDDAFAPPFFVEVRGRTEFGPHGFADTGPGMARQIDLRQLLGAAVAGLEVAGDDMSPWAEPGEIVLYDRERYPKRGQGCVVELKTGERFVRRYERSDGSTLFARALNPDRLDSYALTEVRGVYAVRLRGD